jgi:hypothetical protein
MKKKIRIIKRQLFFYLLFKFFLKINYYIIFFLINLKKKILLYLKLAYFNYDFSRSHFDEV